MESAKLALIELFAGASGADRLYAGAYKCGLLKLVLFITLYVLTFLSPKEIKVLQSVRNVQFMLSFVVIGWMFIDAMYVFVNVIQNQTSFFGQSFKVSSSTEPQVRTLGKLASYVGVVVFPVFLVKWLFQD